MGQFFTGSGYNMPTAQGYSDAYSSGVNAMLGSLGNIFGAESAYIPKFNDIYIKEQSDALKEYNKALQQIGLQGLTQWQPQYANALLKYESEYGSKYLQEQLKRLREADPEYWANYEAQGAQVLEDLAKGSSMNASQIRSSQQDTRAAQAMRGNAYGSAKAAQEVYNQFAAGERLKAQRQNAAASFLASSPYNRMNIGVFTAYQPSVSQNSFGNLFSSAENPFALNAASGAGNSAAGYAANNYRTQMGWDIANMGSLPPFLAMIGQSISGAASGAASGFLSTGSPYGAIAGGILGGVSGGVMGAFGK